MEVPPVCIKCKHYLKKGSCKAFKIIPSIVWSEGDPHTKPLPSQDNKIVFEKDE